MNPSDIQQLYNFTGQTVVLSGGTGVLGGEILCALAGLGANVAALSRKQALPDQLTQRLTGAPGQVVVFQADVLDHEALITAEQAIRARFGLPTILVNGAGGNQPAATTSTTQRFFDLPEEALGSCWTSIYWARYCQPGFWAQPGRTAAGRNPQCFIYERLATADGLGAYSAAKAGLSNLASMASDAHGPGILAQHPGQCDCARVFLTEQNRFLMLERETGQLTPRGQAIFNHIPMGRFGDPADLVGTALWLLSPAAAYVTGIVVPVDGGFSAYSGI